MQIEKTKNAVRNSLSGLICRAVMLVFPFVIRTVIIRELGMKYAGLGSLFTSVLQVLSLSELGFSTAVAYAMYKPIADDDKKLVGALLGFEKKVYYIVGAAILCVGLLVTPFLPHLINGEVPADINLYTLYFIYLFNTVISYFVFSYKGVLLAAFQRTDVENNLMMLTNLAMYALQIVVLFAFKNYYVYIIFLPLCTLGLNIARSVYVNKKYAEFLTFSELDSGVKREVFKNIGALMGHRLSITVVVAVVNIIISAKLGLDDLAVYNNYYYIVNALIAIISVVHSALTAGIGNNIVVHDVDKNYGDFNTLTFLNVWLVGWMAITLMCLYQPFMSIWMDGDTAKMLPDSSALLFVALLYFWKFKDILTTYKDAGGMWRADFWKPYVVAVATLILTLILINTMGMNGVVIALLVGVFVVSMPWETHVFFKQYFHRSAAAYYLRMFIYTAIVAASGVLTYFVCSFLPSSGVLALIIKFLICAVLPNAIFVLCSFKTREFKVLCNKMGGLVKKRGGKKAAAK